MPQVQDPHLPVSANPPVLPVTSKKNAKWDNEDGILRAMSFSAN
jgi:hypothetical protein